MRRTGFYLMLAISVWLWSGCVNAAQGYRLGANDVIRVTVYDNPDLTTVARIAENGSITFPSVGEVSLVGLTAREAELRLAAILEKKEVVKSPQVSLLVVEYESQRVAVLGEVATPGMYVIMRNSNLIDLISQAGGLSEEAGDVAILTHSGGGERMVVDLMSLLEGQARIAVPNVRDGDRIFVPRADQFYVYGQVNRPGTYRLERGMTVMQALSVSGGLTDKGTERGMKIRRVTSNGSEEIIPAELTHELQPSDVLYVKESLF